MENNEYGSGGTLAKRRINPVVAGGLLLLTCAIGCRMLGSGPSDQDVIAAVKKLPPSPPTIGPTYLALIESVQVEERGPYNADGKYWPVRVRVKGEVKIKLTNVFQLGLVDTDAKERPEPVDFAEAARFNKDDYGNWQVAYDYDTQGPKWRLH